MRVFPVENNLLHVVERVEQEMVTPFSPADGHGAISVHTGNENYSMPKERFSNKLLGSGLPALCFQEVFPDFPQTSHYGTQVSVK